MESESFWREFRGICEDRDHGASELARRGLAILAASAHSTVAAEGMALRAQLTAQARCLQEARPSMAPLRNLLNRWCQALTAMPLEDLQSARDFAADAAKVLQTASLRAVTEIAENASYLLAPGSTLMTHSMSSTLVACCRVLKSRGLRMIVTESRPLYEGRRLAQLLSQWGVITTLITEAQMGLFVREADAVLVGADSVLTDGAVVNKVGTHLLALAAHEQQVPFYVCCESFKFHGQGDRARIDLEEMEPAELGFDAPGPITVRNVYFETTPAHLVTGWITEAGVIDSWGAPPHLVSGG